MTGLLGEGRKEVKRLRQSGAVDEMQLWQVPGFGAVLPVRCPSVNEEAHLAERCKENASTVCSSQEVPDSGPSFLKGRLGNVPLFARTVGQPSFAQKLTQGYLTLLCSPSFTICAVSHRITPF